MSLLTSDSAIEERARDTRRILTMTISTAAALAVAVAIYLAAVHKNAFELQQARAEAANPRWLTVHIDTVDHRHTYRENDWISIRESISSSMPYQYKIEANEQWNEASISDFLHVSNGQSIRLELPRFVCCAAGRVGANDEPYTVRTPARFQLKPGTYEMYVTTRRVYKWDYSERAGYASDFECASNLLKIKVVSDSK